VTTAQQTQSDRPALADLAAPDAAGERSPLRRNLALIVAEIVFFGLAVAFCAGRGREAAR
jgi:hypothetical protein